MRKSAATAARTQASDRTEPSSRRDTVRVGEGRSRTSVKEIQADLSPLDFSQVSGSPSAGADSASSGDAGAPADAPDPAPGDTLTGLAPPPRRAAVQPASDAPGEGDTMDVTNVVPTQPPRPTGAE